MARGFRAFCPYIEWINSFCDPESLKIHHKLELERAKILLATPFPFNLGSSQARNVYSSPFIASLKGIRDSESGSGESSVSGTERDPAKDAWRREIDPCMREMYRTKSVDYPMFSASWLQVIDKTKEILDTEGQKNLTLLSDRYFLDGKSRIKLVENLMGGFRSKVGKSWRAAVGRRCFLEFVSEVNEEWELSLHIVDKRDFLELPLKGYYYPELRVQRRAANQKRKVLGQYLIFSYSKLIPGFSIAYREFFSIEQLGAAVSAHLTLIDVFRKSIVRPLEIG